jgi:D-proline reductase (dithiol) PrdB
VGLIQREIERAGISTIGISIVRSFSEKIKPPRTVFLDWPFGHPLGKPFNVAQQRSVLIASFRALCSIRTSGLIVDLSYKWKGEEYRPDKAAPEDQSTDKAGSCLVQIGQKNG